MKHTILKALTVVSLLGLIYATPQADIATIEDARTVATNWIAVMEHVKGDWGGANGATVAEVRELTRGGRSLGYLCNVAPHGFIVVALQKNLAAVKAYSPNCELNPDVDEGLTDLLKSRMLGLITAIEEELGPIEVAPGQDVGEILEIDYADSWAYLNRDVDTFKSELESGQKIDYQEGDTLTETAWNQDWPYNDWCPAPPPGHGCLESHCAVGCVATAAAQIMRYWYWPPYGDDDIYSDTYEWTMMPETLHTSATQDTIDAVAELCSEIGIAVGMDYCEDNCASGATHTEMRGDYKNHFRYDDVVNLKWRYECDFFEWYSRIVEDLQMNRPLQYRNEGHSFVCDGWQVAPGPIYQYHMNWGHGGNIMTNWYTVDQLPDGGDSVENIIEHIFPDVALPAAVNGPFPKEVFPYRYVTRDTDGENGVFEAGQHIQFLPNVTLTGISTSGYKVRFEGTTSDVTVLFTRADESMGIRISGGALTLTNGGRVVFR